MSYPHPIEDVYLPWFGGGGPVVSPPPVDGGGVKPGGTTLLALNETASALAALVLYHTEQKRPAPVSDRLLCEIAQAKTDDMLARGYFAHVTPDGIAPNAWTRRHGLVLPDWYPDDKNNVESLSAGYHTVARVVEGFLTSAGHAAHVFAYNAFFRAHMRMGFGYTSGHTPKGDFVRYYAVYSAP